ncbi:YkvA family protein [uncultured Desulfovibrio sp.]|uniref:YkvA family protein n=1 Tax=uncultured Desulfovibrio sp. TaxID=167968 RepID=UPI0026330820|nr:YkvA family protein [uncultured Desulfovibrio sp.]
MKHADINLEKQCDMHRKNYSENAFWSKIKKYAKRAGLEGIRNALRLFYVLQRPDLPQKVKMTIIGALGYFISPLDLIPDILPVVGFTDDLSVLAAAIAIAASYIDDDVKEKADKKLAEWFGSAA